MAEDPLDPDDPNPPPEVLPPSLTPYPRLSKFGPDSIDRAVSSILEKAIPTREDTAIVNIKLKSPGGESLLLTGVLAANLGKKWGKVDLGGAAYGAIDLKNKEDWEVGVQVVGSW